MRAHTIMSDQGREVEVRRFARPLAWLVAAGVALGCSDSPTGVPKPGTSPQFVASVASSTSATQPLVYVSLPPGSIPNGGDAVLRVARTGIIVEAQLVEGGFDPIAIPAAVGDTINVTVEMTNGTGPVSYAVAVPKPSRPIVVRTFPPKQKRDVPLSMAVMVVFSEPMDPATLTNSAVQLRKSGVAVAGRLEFTDLDHTIAQFVPAALLTAETDYELVVSESLRDVDGMQLESSVTVPFTTGTKSLTFSVQPITKVVAGLQPGTSRVQVIVQVIARSAAGTIATDFTGDVTIALASHPAGGRLWLPTSVRAVEGIATFVDLYLNAIGAGHTLTAKAEGFGVAHSAPFDAGGALVFLNPPTSAFAGISLVPVEVLATDAAGRAVHSFNAALFLSTSPGAPELLGTTAVAAGLFGRAVFSDLLFTQTAPDGVQLIVSSDGVTGDTTGSFPVDRTYLSFAAQPTHTLAGSVIAPVRVVATDQLGNPISRFSGDVTVALSPSQLGGTLSGTRTVRTVNGVASFTDLRVDGFGSGYSLVATTACCAALAQSEPFDMLASQLAFIAQPTQTNATGIITPAIQVAAKDLSGNLLTSYTGLITIALGDSSANTSLSGTTTVAAVNGVASFSDLSIDASGTHTLTARGPGILAATSAPFTITTPWATRAPMPTARSDLGVGVVNGVLYAVGGAVGNYASPVSVVEAYDPATNSWTTRAPMPTARAGFGVGVVGGILYAVGGRISLGGSSVVEAYNPSTNTWTTKAPLPTLRHGLAVGVVNGILYAVGLRLDYYDEVVKATVEAYDPATNQWTTKASMPTARAHLAVGVVNGVLYAFGGFNDNGSPYAHQGAVEAYDPATNSWTARAPMLTPRSNLAAAVVNGVVYALGGYTGEYAALASVEAYDPVTDRWMTKPSLPAAYYGLGVGVIDGVIHVVGGSPGSGGTFARSEHFAYRP